MYAGRDARKRKRKTVRINAYIEFLEGRSFCMFLNVFFDQVNLQNGIDDFDREQFLMF